MSVFKSYDIRGVYKEEIDENFAYKLGRAFVQYTSSDKVVVGRDARESSPSISEALLEGIVDQGADAVDAGLITTPLLYYLSAKHDEFDGAIIVSASHNPPKYTGFKMCRGKADFINKQKGSLEIKKLMEEGKFGNPERGSLVDEDFSDEYINFLSDAAKDDLGDVKMVVDTSNGCVGPIMNKLIDELDLNVTKYFFEPDGAFPNHEPNPLLPESQEVVKDELSKGDYDLGFMVDADGDRAVFFDENGRMIKSSTIAIIWCNHYYPGPNKTFALDVLNYRKSVIDHIEEGGGEAYPSPVGYANVKDVLMEHEGVQGCEYSGHYQHKETHYCDNALLTLVKVLTCMAKPDKTLAELADPYEDKVLTQVNFEVEDKDEKIQKVDDEFEGETLRVDGVSKTFSTHWFNVRKSNTEPLLRVTVEAETEQEVEHVISEVKRVIGVSGEGERYA